MQRAILLRMARTYRTISDAALCVLCGIPPVHLMIEERMSKYDEGQQEEQKRATSRKWQEEWEAEETKRLIPRLEEWAERGDGEITNAKAQLVSGHGCFREYLWKHKRAAERSCPYCGETDDAEHTLFVCPRWAAIRMRAALEAGKK